MICAYCRARTNESPCSTCARSSQLGGRYRLLKETGDSNDIVSFLAEDTRRSEAQVRARYVRLRRVEASAMAARLDKTLGPLASIHHPGLPRYKRTVIAPGKGGTGVWVVREYIDGPTLADAVEKHGPHPLHVVMDLLEGVLSALEALHDNAQPVLHGDVRPEHVRIRSGGVPVLLEFGTITGCFADLGYPARRLRPNPAGQAPEQRAGSPSVQADLYGAGAVAAGLLAGCDPARLQRSGRIAWEEKVRLPGEFGAFLDRLVDPAPGRRPDSAAAARATLDQVRRRLQPHAQAHLVDEEDDHVIEDLPTTMMPAFETSRTQSAIAPSPLDEQPTSEGRLPISADEHGSAATRSLHPTQLASATSSSPPLPTPSPPASSRLPAPAPRQPAVVHSQPPTHDPPTGSFTASQLEATGPRPPTHVRPREKKKPGGAFGNPIFVAVALTALAVALVQIFLKLVE
jgi:serine/threonine kinase PknH